MTARSPTRHIIYVHGFDRRGPRFLNLWQRREARRYTKRHGEGPKIGVLSDASWRIVGSQGETIFEDFDWSDLIRDRFASPFWVGLAAMAGLGATALRQNMIGRVFARDKVMGLMMLWTFVPVFLFAIALVLSAFAGGIAVCATIAVGLALFGALYRFDRHVGVFYAAHIAWAARRLACRDHAGFEARVAAFKERIARIEADEVVLIGHSLGAALVLRLLGDAPEGTKILTLGQSIPLVSLQREAEEERQILARLRDRGTTWIDISAAKDVLGFYGYDPTGGGARCQSARFGRSFAAPRLRRLKWRPFELHFLYICAADMQGGTWDWFRFLGQTVPLDDLDMGKPLPGHGERRGSSGIKPSDHR